MALFVQLYCTAHKCWDFVAIWQGFPSPNQKITKNDIKNHIKITNHQKNGTFSLKTGITAKLWLPVSSIWFHCKKCICGGPIQKVCLNKKSWKYWIWKSKILLFFAQGSFIALVFVCCQGLSVGIVKTNETHSEF